MILASPSLYNVEPIEFEGIRYQQSDTNFMPECPAARGFLEAIDIKTETRLWYKKIYDYWSKVEPEFATTGIECEFLRLKLRAETRELLIENEARGKYFINIDTQEIRKATATDFPPKIKRGPPPEVPPIEWNGFRYAQYIDDRPGLGGPCGMLRCFDLKTGKSQSKELIYKVPFNGEIDDDTQECYFTRMVLLPGEKDILIENEAGDKYLFNLKRCETRPLTVAEADYQPESEPDKISILLRIKAALRVIFGRG